MVLLQVYRRWSASRWTSRLLRRLGPSRRIVEAEEADNEHYQSQEHDHGHNDDRSRGEYLQALVAASDALVLIVVEKIAIYALRASEVRSLFGL